MTGDNDPKPFPFTHGGSTGGINHLVNTSTKCPQCGGTNFEVRNYDEIWRDGDVVCVDCHTFVRTYDAG